MSVWNPANLKAELVRLEMTQRWVAGEMGVTYNYLSKLVNGRLPWNRRSARSFSMVTGIPLDAFYREREEATV